MKQLQSWLRGLSQSSRQPPAFGNIRCRIGFEHPLERKGFGPTNFMNSAPTIECHGLDTPERVCFYEQDFYVLSNFSAFNVLIWGLRFQTAEHAYHWKKFAGYNDDVARWIFYAHSAHHAFKVAQAHKGTRQPDWDSIKVDVMREILREKVTQHDYVERKLAATGSRELVENSWRDDFWGWGPNRDGQNMLGKLWMEVREWVKNQPPIWVNEG